MVLVLFGGGVGGWEVGLLKKHWFCKLVGGWGGADLLKKHWFCKLFGGSGSGFVEKGV